MPVVRQVALVFAALLVLAAALFAGFSILRPLLEGSRTSRIESTATPVSSQDLARPSSTRTPLPSPTLVPATATPPTPPPEPALAPSPSASPAAGILLEPAEIELEEGGTPALYRLELTSQPAVTVTLSVTTEPGSPAVAGSRGFLNQNSTLLAVGLTITLAAVAVLIEWLIHRR